jgi:hypothetical protein
MGMLHPLRQLRNTAGVIRNCMKRETHQSGSQREFRWDLLKMGVTPFSYRSLIIVE